MAKTPKTEGAAKAARPVGPTRVFIVLNEGADAAAVRAAIASVTTDKSAVLDFDNGKMLPFIPMTLARGARAKGTPVEG